MGLSLAVSRRDGGLLRRFAGVSQKPRTAVVSADLLLRHLRPGHPLLDAASAAAAGDTAGFLRLRPCVAGQLCLFARPDADAARRGGAAVPDGAVLAGAGVLPAAVWAVCHLRRSAFQRPHVRLDDDAGVVRCAGARLGETDGKRAAAPVLRNGTGLHSAGVRPVDGLLLLGERHADESLLLVRFPADPRFAFVSARSAKGGDSVTYIENVFVCMAAPLVVALLSLKRGQRAALVFCLAGMGACLLSAYLNTFFARLYQADAVNAATQIAPVVEEVMKLLPLLFYLLIFEPKAEQIKNAAVITALSFATFENVCYLIQNGAGHFSFIFFRGIGTGAMHVICGAIVGGGLAYVWQRTWLKIAGTCGLLGAAITFHAIYNLLIAYGGAAQYIAYLLPVLILAAGKLIFRSSIQ